MLLGVANVFRENNNMAVRVFTAKPKGLLKAFKDAIDDGEISTWEYNKQGDFAHTGKQFKEKAWFQPRIVTGAELAFALLTPKDGFDDDFIDPYYHGHLVITLRNHFIKRFTSIRVE